MDKVFVVIAMIAMLGVVVSLIAGLFVMARGTPKDHQLSQKMMQLRIACQGAAIFFLLLAYFSKH